MHVLFNKKYKPSYVNALKDLLAHTSFYMTSFYGMWYFRDSYVSLLTVPLFGCMNIRTFIVLHDCGHNSYTPDKTLNYIIGSIFGIFSCTPFCWSYDHNNHHLTSGNMENKLHHSQNETVFHTLRDYTEMGNKRYIYRAIMSRFVFFIFIAPLKFIILNRFTTFVYKYNNHPYKQSLNRILCDTMINNIGTYILLTVLNNYGMFYHYLISTMIASSVGFMLFHNQHTFNPSYVVTNDTWNKKDSGMIGSSFIQIPAYLKFFTAGIEYHHIHHANASIPGYNLPRLHEELLKNTDELNNMTTLSITECYHNLQLSLYDDKTQKYITFEEAEKILNLSRYHSS